MKRILILVIIMLMLCGMVSALAEMPVLDPSAGPFRAQPTQQPRPNVVLPGWKEINIAANETQVWMPFYNPEKNDGWYYLTFALWAALPEEDIAEGTQTQLVKETDKETGEVREVLYARLSQSGLVPAGLYLQDVKLFQPVPAGSYPAFVMMQPYRVQEMTPTANNGRVALQLNAIKVD